MDDEFVRGLVKRSGRLESSDVGSLRIKSDFEFRAKTGNVREPVRSFRSIQSFQ